MREGIGSRAVPIERNCMARCSAIASRRLRHRQIHMARSQAVRIQRPAARAHVTLASSPAGLVTKSATQ